MAAETEARLRFTASDQTNAAFRSVEARLRGLQRTSSETNSIIERSGLRFVQGAAGFTRQVGALTGGFLGGRLLKDAIVDLAAYDRQLTRIGITANASRDQMAQVGSAIRQLANSTGQSIGDVTEGLQALVVSGMSFDDAMARLPAIARANAAMGANMKETADTATVLAGNMKISTAEMERAFDIMAAGADKGKFEAKDMAAAMPTLAAQAAQMGMTGTKGLAQLVAMLQTVRNEVGTSGETVTAMTDLMGRATSEELVGKFKEVGVNLDNELNKARRTGGNLMGVFLAQTDIALQQLAKINEVPMEKRFGLLGKLFTEKDSRRAALALLTSKEGTVAMAKALQDVDGTNLRNLARVTDDLASKVQRLENSWDGFKKSLGEALVFGGAQELMDNLTGSVNGLAEALKAVRDLPAQVKAAFIPNFADIERAMEVFARRGSFGAAELPPDRDEGARLGPGQSLEDHARRAMPPGRNFQEWLERDLLGLRPGAAEDAMRAEPAPGQPPPPDPAAAGREFIRQRRERRAPTPEPMRPPETSGRDPETTGSADEPELDPRYSHGGSLVSGIINAIREAATAPKRAYTGELAMRDTRGRISEEAIREATNLAGTVALGNAPRALRRGTPGEVELGMFGGPRAQTADLGALNAAKRMAKEGQDATAILRETGWFRGQDGKWRFEIPDTGVTMHPQIQHEVPRLKPGETFDTFASEALRHKKLFEAYPQLAEQPMGFGRRGPGEPGPTGAFTHNRKTGDMVFDVFAANERERLRTSLHELQHGIQRLEGFKGGAVIPESAYKTGRVPPDVWERYFNAPGEREARAVERRSMMTPEQLQQWPPWTVRGGGTAAGVAGGAGAASASPRAPGSSTENTQQQILDESRRSRSLWERLFNRTSLEGEGNARIQLASLGGTGEGGAFGGAPGGGRFGGALPSMRRGGGGGPGDAQDGRGGGGGGGGGRDVSAAPGGPARDLGTAGGRNLTDLINREARAAGIDPRIMQGIRAGESGHGANYDKKHDAIESSWGPFQLNRRRGLGVQFEKETGLDVRDPSTIAAQARWVAQFIAKGGSLRHWMGYHGPRNADPRWGDSGYVPQGERAAGAGAGAGAGTDALRHAMEQANRGGDTVTSGVRDPSHPLSRRNPRSAHTQGRAFDLRARTPEEADAAMARQRERFNAQGMVEGRDYKFIDEVRRPSGHATGPHVHVEMTGEGKTRYSEGLGRSRAAEGGLGEPRRVRTTREPAAPDEGREGARPGPGQGIAPQTDAVGELQRLRDEAQKPIPIRFEGGLPAIRERGALQARRELSHEMRDARYGGYSDVGVA